MTDSSSHSACGRATGKPFGCRAAMTRYSRSTACAEGSSLPGGLRLSTKRRPSAAVRRYVGFDWPPLNCSICAMRKPRNFSSAPPSMRCRSSTGFVPMNCSNMGFEAYPRMLAPLWSNLQPESHRPVVHQADLHGGAEAPRGYVGRLGRFLRELHEQELAIGRRRGAGKAGTQPAIGIGRERELRHREQLAADVLEREIHLALAVGKDAVGEHALGEALRLHLAVAALDADQRKDAFADGGDFGAVDAHGSRADALDESNQAMMSGMRRARMRWI